MFALEPQHWPQLLHDAGRCRRSRQRCACPSDSPATPRPHLHRQSNCLGTTQHRHGSVSNDQQGQQEVGHARAGGRTHACERFHAGWPLPLAAAGPGPALADQRRLLHRISRLRCYCSACRAVAGSRAALDVRCHLAGLIRHALSGGGRFVDGLRFWRHTKHTGFSTQQLAA